MSLEQAIHERWAEAAALVTLVPVERLSTGLAKGDQPLPYVVLSRQGSVPRWRGTGGLAIEETRVRFGVWSDDLDVAKEIEREIRAAFDRTSFGLPGGTCLVMQWESELEVADAEGMWQVATDYVARVSGS